MAGWFDSHCHVQEEYLGGDRAADGDGDPELEPVLARAREAGIDRLVCIGTGAATSDQAVRVARATAGAGARRRGRGRPSGCTHTRRTRASTRWRSCSARELAVGDGAVVAVGECGLDYYYEHSPRDAQRAAFAAQIALAHAHGLALVIHARDAWSDLFDVLGAGGCARSDRAALLHGWSRRGRALPPRRHVRVVQRHRDVQECGRRRAPPRRAARWTGCSWKPTVRSSPRCPTAAVRTSRPTSRSSERRSPPSRVAAPARHGELGRGRGHGVFHRRVIHALLCVIREPCDQGVSL